MQREEWISCIRNFPEGQKRREKKEESRHKREGWWERIVACKHRETNLSRLTLCVYLLASKHTIHLLSCSFSFSLSFFSSIFLACIHRQHHKVSIGFPSMLLMLRHSYSRLKRRRRRKGNNQQHAKPHQMTPHSQYWRMIMMMMTIISSSYSMQVNMLRWKQRTWILMGPTFTNSFSLFLIWTWGTVTYSFEGDLFTTIRSNSCPSLFDDCCPV